MVLLVAHLHEGMPVIGSDARLVGHVDRAGRSHIKLKRDEAGRHRLLSTQAIAAVDGRQVTLQMPAAEAPLTETA